FITLVCGPAMHGLSITAGPSITTSFMGLSLLDWNKANLIDDFLPNRAQSEIKECLRNPTRFAIGIVKGWSAVGIGVVLHTLDGRDGAIDRNNFRSTGFGISRSEEHTSELQSPYDLVCRLLLEKKKKKK